jgi:Protein tyrosine and serine/threonine kinase
MPFFPLVLSYFLSVAPEVIKMESYDTKADVYSFAILLWEILALRPSCQNMTPSEFVDRIVVQNERFPIHKSWPPLTRLLLPEAWDVNPSKRPDMKRVAIILRGDLNDMTNDETVLRRTNHMRDRSDHSFKDVLDND